MIQIPVKFISKCPFDYKSAFAAGSGLTLNRWRHIALFNVDQNRWRHVASGLNLSIPNFVWLSIIFMSQVDLYFRSSHVKLDLVSLADKARRLHRQYSTSSARVSLKLEHSIWPAWNLHFVWRCQITTLITLMLSNHCMRQMCQEPNVVYKQKLVFSIVLGFRLIPLWVMIYISAQGVQEVTLLT